MDTPLSKKVSMIELFYDLVFAYMISQATELLHNLQHGVVSTNSFILFFLVVIVFINSWMIETVFTNRYGESSWTDITFYFIDMIILLFMTNSFSVTSFRNLRIFLIATGLLSLTLGLQYLIEYCKTNELADKRISLAFFKITSIRTILVLLGAWLNSFTGFIIAIIGIILTWIMPAFTGKLTKQHPIIFSHLLERLTLLIIITFGETIIGIADYFKPSDFSIFSIFVFIIVASLFFTYIAEFDHLIEEKQIGTTGNLLIYLHYFILFGLSLITVSLKFIYQADANMTFAISSLYLGVLLFYIGIFIANKYNKEKLKFNKYEIGLILLTTVIGYGISISTLSFEVTTIVSAVVTLINAATLVRKLYLIR